MSSIIKVEKVSKEFIISHEAAEKYTTLRDVMARKAKKIFSFSRSNSSGKKAVTRESYMALNEVSFEVKPGERLGIIGRNGAGKSTLLKVLSRITEPSAGRIEINGRVASLLEVGTGFHPELTGRENIFLNGAILGMSRAEIKRKFDEIVDFSEVEKFLDTPVKRYSSGMYVRLAFAVAAHLEPEILVVDEVLAVGDAQFQKKCLGKMKDVSSNGRTVLFVSHNMAAVKNLCTHGILLNKGQLEFDGPILDAVTLYQKGQNTSTLFSHKGPLSEAPGNANIRILRFEVTPIEGDVISISSGINFEISFYNQKEDINLDITFDLKNEDDVVILHQGEIVTKERDSRQGIYTVKGQLPPHLLNTGTYTFTLIFGENQQHPLFGVHDFLQFEVMNERLGNTFRRLPGIIRPKIEYSSSFQLLKDAEHSW
ncbi:polysaccharide/polyol phosphate ABC transporter ATP-binding protein [Niastella koreensis]|uniref:Teichoic-acid-transporting ATPase n=2 Tax=Niastella koreensis TaxID=354356 RepID=G8TK36_NIAKG|nr:ABC transporter ATP-binding protein [Niastella koreensis]AEW02974.1 Teichoic-acid-transporting ATPase [Niastella koreensis GR20-10]OQP55289.1 polysaccharide/polyol phosphate ABC transporter ATP-binding protein [Niastella koreensis]